MESPLCRLQLQLPGPASGRTRAAAPRFLSPRWAPRRPLPTRFLHQRHVRASPCPGGGRAPRAKPLQRPGADRSPQWVPASSSPPRPPPMGVEPLGERSPRLGQHCVAPPERPGPRQPPEQGSSSGEVHVLPGAALARGSGAVDTGLSHSSDKGVRGRGRARGGRQERRHRGGRLKNALCVVNVAFVEVKDDLKVEKAMRKREV